MKKILVTGGMGFIGQYVVERLKEKGYEPTIFDHHQKQGKIFSGDALRGVMETRVFEMGGIGLLAIDRTDINRDDLDWYATADKDYIAYQTKEELVDKVNQVLQNETKWRTMRQAGIANVLKRHTYDIRARELLQHLTGEKSLRRLS